MINASDTFQRFIRFLRPKQLAYRTTFQGSGADTVLRDLSHFCFACAPTSSERELGRRDVWLHIQQFLRMKEEDLAVLHAKLGPEARHQLWHPSSTYLTEEEN